MDYEDSEFTCSCTSCVLSIKKITCKTCWNSWCATCIFNKIQQRGNTTCTVCFMPLTWNDFNDQLPKDFFLTKCKPFWRGRQSLVNHFENQIYQYRPVCCSAFLTQQTCPTCKKEICSLCARTKCTKKNECERSPSFAQLNCPNCLIAITVTQKNDLRCPFCLITICKMTGKILNSNFCLLPGTLLLSSTNAENIFNRFIVPITSPLLVFLFNLKQTILKLQQQQLFSFFDWSFVYAIGRLYTRLFGGDEDVLVEQIAHGINTESTATNRQQFPDENVDFWYQALLVDKYAQIKLTGKLSQFFFQVGQEVLSLSSLLTSSLSHEFAQLEKKFTQIPNSASCFSNVPSKFDFAIAYKQKGNTITATTVEKKVDFFSVAAAANKKVDFFGVSNNQSTPPSNFKNLSRF